MNNLNIYLSFAFFIIAMIVSNTIVYNIGIKNGKRMYIDELAVKRIEGIKRSHAEGKYFKQLPDNYMDIVTKWVNGEIGTNQTSIELGISTSTLYRRFGHLRKK